jgi:MarR family multiple gene transcriptional regulator MgrA
MFTLEELIRMKSFESDKQKAVVGLMYVAGLIKKHQEKILSRENLTYQQFNILRILRGQSGNAVSINLIKERMIDQTSDVSRITDRMGKAGLISVKPNKDDKRVRDVLITPKGLDAVTGIDKFFDEMCNAPIPLVDEDVKELNIMLEQILNRVAD